MFNPAVAGSYCLRLLSSLYQSTDTMSTGGMWMENVTKHRICAIVKRYREDSSHEEESVKKSTIAVLVVLLTIVVTFQLMKSDDVEYRTVDYSYIKDIIRTEKENITGVTITPETINVSVRDNPVPYQARLVPQDKDLVAQLDAAGIAYRSENPVSWGKVIGSIFSAILPIALIVALIFFLPRIMGGKMRMRKSVQTSAVVTRFVDVAGCDHAKGELMEIVQYLRDPSQIKALGGRIPKGVLLYGPPGTGKTLLARAVAGEANAKFLSVSGSEFVEMFVGVGASRVRALFETAKKNAPAIIFIDEIDAVGRTRGQDGGGSGGGEKDTTINQLLVEMDGFTTAGDHPVIVMAATNRPEILDPALIREGRFDLRVRVELPDVHGREAILGIHTRSVALADDVKLSRIAQKTSGFSGAGLEKLVNEAIRTVLRENGKIVTERHIVSAIEQVIAGPENKNRHLNEGTKRRVGFHEVGHAIVSIALHGIESVTKISVVPRGNALGMTFQNLSEEERHLMTTEGLCDDIAVLLGGRAAEEIVFGDISTGAADDIKKANSRARRLVTEFGMSKRLLNFACEETDGHGNVRRLFPVSPEMDEAIEEGRREIVNTEYARAKRIIETHRVVFDTAAEQLIREESIEGDDLRKLFSDVKPVTESIHAVV